MAYSILVVEDDRALARQISGLLQRYGYDCPEIFDFDSIDAQVREMRPDLILLDVNLPRFDGFYWCRKIRESTKAPILMVSARDGTSDQVRGMESGADDYIAKPFDPDILLAKVNAAIRRSYGELRDDAFPEGVIQKEGVSFWPRRQTVAFGDASAELSPTESSLFQSLLAAYPDAVSRGELFLDVWDGASFVEDNTLNVNIRRLRGKFAQRGIPIEVKTVRSFGYRLAIAGEGA